MSKNWMRHFELQLIDEDGNGLDFGGFKVVFNIDWFNISTSAITGTFKIYNLRNDTANRIIRDKEFTRIRVIAGYDGIYEIPIVDVSEINKPREITEQEAKDMTGQNFGLIFSGDIRYAITGKDNPTDSYVLIQAADTDLAFSTTTTATTVAKGYQVVDTYRALMRDFNANGVTQGLLTAMPETVFPRGKVLLGMTRNLMDGVAAQCSATWQFVDGQINMVSNNEYVHEAIVLNSQTGLIGMPQQTFGSGINVRALINPNIRMGGLIQLDQNSVYRTALTNNDIALGYGSFYERTDDSGNLVTVGDVDDEDGNIVEGPPLSGPASIAMDGIYIVRGIMYTGDTRGQPWYMDMMCFARDTEELLSNTALQRGA